ncbi:MAG TPA: mandelate racemase/muconate lactonizing enzyme family protein [Hypericibacter adhaerens]|jgi:D-galactarolactone cycloisomerase|uniref:2-oxo-3-deoxygalactonate 6-phosphate aldolase n=1 Tax=Hypericibacter adhaerens TaxID=2602016 RepID=A0A5J6NAA9_9PROT|nr:mandelate racemase/muconate lactonizing enzyme family protein [Hypericibacter adhaerens]QEX24656.1 2-oxo-3-deoxygalactonate 6-phosphate aldolase [Hypericibacter adhaerens]HWA45866.1 mandelate racemase/muconate lactonizing enzyme family protein [Hypericibacter adhaerens]
MKITDLDVHILRAPNTERPNWVSNFIVPRANEVLVRLRTDEGIEGIGMATSYGSVQPSIEAFKSGIAGQILGADALAPERLYEKLFSLTSQRLAHEKGWGREPLIRIAAAVDIACWDIVGKAAGLPLWRLFGGYRARIPYYVTCAYYRDGKDLIELRDEILALKEQGHTRFKGKVGGLTLSEDRARMEVVRDAIGPDCDLMIDVNRGWDLPTAIEGARLMEPLKPTWLEEPIQWADDRRGLKLLSRQTRIPLSAGESETTSFGCRALLEEEAIAILQFDCTMAGGFTEGRKLAALCELNHVQVAPHHDCFIHAQLVASTPAGRIVESFPDPDRDPLQAELFENPPALSKGWLTLNETPGLGLSLSPAAMKKFGERIL